MSTSLATPNKEIDDDDEDIYGSNAFLEDHTKT